MTPRLSACTRKDQTLQGFGRLNFTNDSNVSGISFVWRYWTYLLAICHIVSVCLIDTTQDELSHGWQQKLLLVRSVGVIVNFSPWLGFDFEEHCTRLGLSHESNRDLQHSNSWKLDESFQVQGIWWIDKNLAVKSSAWKGRPHYSIFIFTKNSCRIHIEQPAVNDPWLSIQISNCIPQVPQKHTERLNFFFVTITHMLAAKLKKIARNCVEVQGHNVRCWQSVPSSNPFLQGSKSAQN